MFIQSRVPEHAELFLLLAMMTPLGWLERVPTYKDQQQKLNDRDLSTYGFLGYPLMQAADILIYRANMVPVGEDQVPHIEMTREIARRFNHIYGARAGLRGQGARPRCKKLGGKARASSTELRTRFQEQGDDAALEQARALLDAGAEPCRWATASGCSATSRARGRVILAEPAALLTETPKVPGLDGQKMSKTYGNAILMREEPEGGDEEDPHDADRSGARASQRSGRARERCPVWPLHQIYSRRANAEWVADGVPTAGIGCLECKQPVIDAIVAEQAPMRERAQRYLDDPALVRNIVADGCDARASHGRGNDARRARGDGPCLRLKLARPAQATNCGLRIRSRAIRRRGSFGSAPASAQVPGCSTSPAGMGVMRDISPAGAAGSRRSMSIRPAASR